MALTEVYVDPSVAADSGSGTIGDPYGDLEYAIEQSTLGADGTRFNIKAGTDEVLAAQLDTALSDTGTTAAFAPDGDQPVVFQGYTATAGDGGLCGISGGDAVAIISTSKNNIWFIDCHLHSCGAGNVVLALSNWGIVARCHIEAENTSGFSVLAGTYGKLYDNYVTMTGGGSGVDVLRAGTVGYIARNYVDMTGASNLTTAITCNGSVAENNIVVADSGYGIEVLNSGVVRNNSIYASASTRIGISCAGVNPQIVEDNLIEGFSGVGGIGITAAEPLPSGGGNAVYNCTTDYNITNSTGLDRGDNETLTTSPFASPGTGDFSPVDTGNVKEGSLPQVIGGGLV